MSKIPTIAMIPSGYKANKLYSVLPTNGDADLDFARLGESTRTNPLGLIETVATGVPRLDYSEGSCPTVLAEKASTNLAEYSEDFSNGVWALSGATITPNTTTAPDGNLTADTLTSTGTGNIQQVYTGLTAKNYNTSFYIKRKTGTGVVNIKSVENINTPITVTNEWTRVDLTTQSTTTVIRIGIKLDTIGDEVYLWGGQLEQSDVATKYIPNLTTGSTTRVEDLLDKSGLSNYLNDTKGSLIIDLKSLSGDNEILRELNLSNGTFDNSFRLNLNTVTNQVFLRYRIGAVTEKTLTYTVADVQDYNKIGIGWNGLDIYLWVNANKNSDTVSANISGLDKISFYREGTSTCMNVAVKSFKVYNELLTDAEFIEKTT